MRKLLAYLMALFVASTFGCSSINGGLLVSKPALPTNIAGVSVSDAGDNILIRRIHLKADADTIFQFMTDFEKMPEWMPGLDKVTVDHQQSQNGPHQCGTGSVRTCYAKGMKLSERVIHYHRPYSFAVELAEASTLAPLSKGTGVVKISPTQNGECDVTYSVLYDTKSLHPMSPVMPFMFKKQLSEGLDNVIAHFGGYRIE